MNKIILLFAFILLSPSIAFARYHYRSRIAHDMSEGERILIVLFVVIAAIFLFVQEKLQKRRMKKKDAFKKVDTEKK